MTPIRPKFQNPPLIERAISVTFKNLEQFTLGDFGLFWSRIRVDFPVSEAKPLVRQEHEEFGEFRPIQQQIQIVPEETLPRAFYRNPERGELVQIQSDRFSFNWIKTNTDHAYPHSEAVLKRFFTLLDNFTTFVAERQIGEIVPVQCELTNVNVIPVSDVGEAFPDVATVVRLPQLSNQYDCIKLESQIAGSKHLLLADDGTPIGRVHSLGQPSLQVETGEKAFRLDIVARGAPTAPSIAGVKAFLERAASAVNAVFLASVTQAGRQFWGEIDG